MAHSNPAVTLSVRILPEVRDQLEELSGVTGRTKSFLAAEAIENYLVVRAWQIRAVEKAIKKADSKNTRFVAHTRVTDWVNSWDSKKEKKIPK